MRVRLHRSLITQLAKYAVGTVLNISKGYAERLISEGKAEKYKGPYPPTEKLKIKADFFKLQKNGNH
jgi:hypothetical protein